MGALSQIARKGDPFLLREALGRGLDPDGDGKTVRTPLYSAAWEGHEVCVRILCDFGANPNRYDDRGALPLDGATTLAMRRLLLSHGADPDLRKDGMSRAAFFASFGNRELVDLFLSFGASENEKTQDGRTIHELLEDPSHWISPAQRMRNFENNHKSDDGSLRFVLKISQGFAISPEEYVVRNPNILVWGMHRDQYEDPRAGPWTKRVAELLGSTALREEAIRRFLEGEPLERALRRVRREQMVETERSRIKSAQAKYLAHYY